MLSLLVTSQNTHEVWLCMHELGMQNQDWKTYAYKGRRDIGLMKKDWPGSEVRAQETIPSHSAHDRRPEQVRMVQVHL